MQPACTVRAVASSWLTAIEVVYVVLLSTWIVLEKRRPLATLAWILGLSLLPVAGLLVYYLLGPRKLERQRRKRERAARRLRSSAPELQAVAAPSVRSLPDDLQLRQLVTLAWNNAEAPLTDGNEVTALQDGHDCYAALESAITEAQHHVHLAYYTYQPDATGQRFRDLLTRKAREGVEVRLLVDAVGSSALTRRFLAPLRDAGAEVATFNPVRLPGLRPVNFRNHRKLVVVDGQVGFTGGINIGDEYLGRGANGPWRDTHLRIDGPAVASLQAIFVEDWHFATGTALQQPGLFEARRHPDRDQRVQVVGSGPDRDWQTIQQLYVTAIGQARERVRLSTPYFVPDEVMLAALEVASLRGVEVELLLSRRTDAPLVRAAARSYYDDLLRAGVRIFEYQPGFLHAKQLVVDTCFAAVGSANFDPRSFRLNFEASALIHGGPLPLELATRFDSDLTRSQEVLLGARRRLGLAQRLAEAGARVLSPML